MEDSPCKICLVLPTCKNLMCRKDHLIVEYLRTCPFANDYITEDDNKTLHRFEFHKRINQICELFDIEDSSFLWRANELGIYNDPQFPQLSIDWK